MQEGVQRDYSLCTPLHGPPRNRDRIAYKVSNTGVVNHFLILQNQENKQLLRTRHWDWNIYLKLATVKQNGTLSLSIMRSLSAFKVIFGHGFVKCCLLCATKIID